MKHPPKTMIDDLPRSRAVLAMSDDRPTSVADIVVEELRKKEINGPILSPKRDLCKSGPTH